jgi:hypothetical protein
MGKGDGTFGAAQTFVVGTEPAAIAVGDFNGDGFPDLAVANTGSNSVAVLLNSANGSAAQAGSFAVSGFPSPVTVGTAGKFTVTARKVDGSTATNYTGTVHFTSTDPQVALPADYTFTAADAGVHTFRATLKTAGTQSLTATDTTSAINGTDAGIAVNPAAASTLSVAGFPSPITAGVAGSFTVTARDPYGNIATGYTGTVHFSSSDARASLPANYTFTAADAGRHTFSATLKTAGTQSLTAPDPTTASLRGSEAGIIVKAAAASKFLLSALASVRAGVAFSLTLTVEDTYGNVVTGYTGTVRFRSSDRTATLPPSYTFTAADQGVHKFTGLVLRKRGYQTITITDTLNSSLTDSCATPPTSPRGSSRPGCTTPAICHARATSPGTSACMSWLGPVTSCGSSTPASPVCVRSIPITASCRAGGPRSSAPWPPRTAATSTVWQWWTPSRSMLALWVRPTGAAVGGRTRPRAGA